MDLVGIRLLIFISRIGPVEGSLLGWDPMRTYETQPDAQGGFNTESIVLVVVGYATCGVRINFVC